MLMNQILHLKILGKNQNPLHTNYWILKYQIGNYVFNLTIDDFAHQRSWTEWPKTGNRYGHFPVAIMMDA